MGMELRTRLDLAHGDTRGTQFWRKSRRHAPCSRAGMKWRMGSVAPLLVVLSAVAPIASMTGACGSNPAPTCPAPSAISWKGADGGFGACTFPDGTKCSGFVPLNCGGATVPCSCSAGIWECMASIPDGSPGTCDAASDVDASTCPAPAAVVAGTACTSEGSACGGTILDSCGHPESPVFQCSCSAGIWRCLGTEVDAGGCDAGHD